MTDNGTLGFALVGCGRIAAKHAQILGGGDVERARLVAVCDIVAERAETLGAKHGVPYFTDMHAMMDAHDGDIDVICILTESGLHAEHTIALSCYGKHMVVEKPMALTLHDADEMIRICDDAGIKLFVVKQNRYNLPVRKLRQALEAGRFGKLVMGTVRVRWKRDQAYYDQDSWRGTWAMDGGVFANQASHHIDLLEWCMGSAATVYARTNTALVDIESEDTGVVIIAFKNGAIGVIEATTATRPKDIEGSISILGEHGTVEIGGFAVNEMRQWHFTEALPEDNEVLGTYRENPPDVYGFGHVAYLDHVVDVIVNDSPSLVDGPEGRKSLELITAIYQSAETGQEVEVSSQKRDIRLGRR
ncbi:MAG: Gfo/Idh/MocA family oxidoreductase [Alphaproteobacteria bacterium]|jgi:predicted dehydrogenase|nr:Gfo/Idh/MocA family oxidoreductase [Alphaproteobacteria bacterium]HJO88471.1 Gfo/Idh/MocA family oxidoreductase [Alphaproteobacteria bacterium]